MKKYLIKVKNLEKKFDKNTAVKGVTFSIEKGKLFSLLGQNGAGKSTTINMICGILKPTSGTIILEDKEINKNQAFIKKNLGVVFQNCILDEELSVYENIRLTTSLYNVDKKTFTERYKFLAKKFNIEGFEKRLVKKLSGGQKRKTDILRALIHSPKMLILDEPTTGLDPESRVQIWNVLANLQKSENLTILLTTHYLEEAEKSSYIAIMSEGKIAAEGTSSELKNKYNNDVLKIYGKNLNAICTKLKKQKIDANVQEDYIEVFSKKKGDLSKIVAKNSDLINDFELIKGNLDNVFINVIGKETTNE